LICLNAPKSVFQDAVKGMRGSYLKGAQYNGALFYWIFIGILTERKREKRDLSVASPKLRKKNIKSCGMERFFYI